MQRPSTSNDRKWISNAEFFSSSDLEGEIWIDFKFYQGHQLKDGYSISNKGRIKGKSGSIIVGSISFDGYHEVALQGDTGSIIARVHRAVLHAFSKPYPKDMKYPTCQHLNHNKLDNRLENLCWMSSFENNQEGHGVRCKVVDKAGEHEFPSQKVASCYLGRHEDYISEGISNNYKLTNADGEEVEIYTEIEGQWVRYCRSMPNNRRWCKIVTPFGETSFESFLQCDRYLGKPEGYTSNSIKNGWPVCNDANSEFYVYSSETSCYNKYIPDCSKPRSFKTACKITDIEGEHHFDSISSAARYIGRDAEYLRIALKEGRVVKDKNGVAVTGTIVLTNLK